jgi:hypothetical protein
LVDVQVAYGPRRLAVCPVDPQQVEPVEPGHADRRSLRVGACQGSQANRFGRSLVRSKPYPSGDILPISPALLMESPRAPIARLAA